jgi:drug/metabolite transporter (DMT)-like permease
MILLLLAGLVWSVGGVFVKTSGLHPMVISSIRGGTAALIFFIVLKGRPRFTWSAPQVVGALCYCGVLTMFVVSTTLTSAANAILLQYVSPVVVAFLAFLLIRERLHKLDFVSVGLVTTGLIMMIYGSFGDKLSGNLVAILAGIVYGTFIVMMRMQKDESPYETVLLGNIFTFLLGVPFYFIFPAELPYVPPILFLGAFQIALPYLLLSYSSKHAKAIDISLLTILEPIMNPVWVFLVTGENPGRNTIIGGAIMLGAVVLKSTLTMKEKPLR